MSDIFQNKIKPLPFAVMMFILFSSSGASGRLFAQTGDEENARLKTSEKSAEISGIKFSCAPKTISKLSRDMAIYLRELHIAAPLVVKVSPDSGTLIYTLNTAQADTNTLDFYQRKPYQIKDDVLRLPIKGGKTRSVSTVSKKEILLTLLQHGRLTTLSSAACTIDALRDHVAVRQNVVAWTDNLSWGWPDGERAYWNKEYWESGTPLSNVSVDKALMDTFLNQDKYSIGCYTATKISYSHAVLDYYARVKKNPAKAALVRRRLMHDDDPLVGVEPAEMWDFDKTTRDIPGKILNIKRDVAKDNFVPGDWIYLLNTNRSSYKKTGYEGSNAVYLGGGKFDDYYNDHHHSYTYSEKVNEVYQWRNGVFNSRRDAAKIKPITDEDIARLSETPKNGGLLLNFRVAPYFFSYENLPALPTQ